MIHVVLSTDSNYAPYAGVVMSSLLYRYKGEKEINFYILGDQLSTSDIEQIRSITQKGDTRKKLYNIDFIDVSDVLPKDLHTSAHITKSTYSRLMIANLLPKTVDKVLYLDCDMLVVSNIEPLWETELNDCLVGAVSDYGILSSKRVLSNKKKETNIDFSQGYFNAGLLLINVNAWRQYKVGEKLIEECVNNKYQHHDQDALNVICYQKWVELNLKWNIIPPVFMMMFKVIKISKFRRNAVKALEEPGIIHWAGKFKPWQADSIQGLNNQYVDFLNMLSITCFNSRTLNKSYLRRKKINTKIAQLVLSIMLFFK